YVNQTDNLELDRQQTGGRTSAGDRAAIAPRGRWFRMCTPDSQSSGAASFSSVAEALRMADASMDYLNSPTAADLPASACGEALITMGVLRAKFTAAYAGFLRRFDALDGHDGDGYGTSAAWLAAMTKLAKKDAQAAVRQMRELNVHPHL